MNFLKSLFGKRKPIIMEGRDGFKFEYGKQYFKEYHVVFPDKLKKNESVTITWDLVDGVNAEQLIDEIKGSCSCTASFSWEGSKVTAVFTNQETDIPENGKSVTKSLTVWFNDGKKKRNNGRGQMAWDPIKQNVKLKFSGTVING